MALPTRDPREELEEPDDAECPPGAAAATAGTWGDDDRSQAMHDDDQAEGLEEEDPPTAGRQLLGWAARQVPDAKGLVIAVGKQLGILSCGPSAGARTRLRRPGWFVFEIDAQTHSPVLLFHYPSSQPAGFAYLRRSVKLEFGSLTDQQPTGRHPVRPWLADALPAAFPDWRCEVVALEVERSFWEKATILHAEYHRPAEKPMPDRFSRHYADLAALARHPIASRAVDRPDLRDRVVAWKGRFFGSMWANYELARPGTFRLVPPAWRETALRRDYQAMRDMYLSEPASFDEILATLAELEDRINS